MARAFRPLRDPLLRRRRQTPDGSPVGTTARYHADLPPRPLPPCTLEQAAQYLETIMGVLRAGPSTGPPRWTRSEEKNLYRLIRVWRYRADGRDPRWLLVGSRGGRLSAAVEKALQPPADPAWTEGDPEP